MGEAVLSYYPCMSPESSVRQEPFKAPGEHAPTNQYTCHLIITSRLHSSDYQIIFFRIICSVVYINRNPLE